MTYELIDRYPDLPGVRLDTDEDEGRTGPAIDLGWDGRIHIWVRESGTGEGKSVRVNLSADNLRALRDGCTRQLVKLGWEREVTVAMPINKPPYTKGAR